MASRYLRATGNWNGSVWAATPSGAAGSASAPTSSDNVYITANFTVTLTEDVVVTGFDQYVGSLVLNGYTMSSGWFQSYGSSARTLNLTNGGLIISNQFGNSAANMFDVGGSNLNLITDGSTLEFRGGPNARTVALSNYTYNDVLLSLGDWDPSGQTLSITGSPTFRSLIIQSKNSAAHTVRMSDGYSQITTNKFVAIGSSAANRLTLSADAPINGRVNFTSGGSCYGQFVAIDGLGTGGSGVPFYIGSNSTDPAGQWSEWLLQDPPKISTLVDPLTTAPGSNSNWAVSGSITTTTGGYTSASTGTIRTDNTYDLIGSEIVITRPPSTNGSYTGFIGAGTPGGGEPTDASLMWLVMDMGGPLQEQSVYGEYGEHGMSFGSNYNYPTTTTNYLKLAVSPTGAFVMSTSANGSSWTSVLSGQLNATEMLMYRSVRLQSQLVSGSILGAINPILNNPPTTVLNSPADNPPLTITDNFTDSNGTHLDNHVADTGQSWSRIDYTTLGQHTTISSNSLIGTNSYHTNQYRLEHYIDSETYDVSWEIYNKSTGDNTMFAVYIATGGGGGFVFEYDSNGSTLSIGRVIGSGSGGTSIVVSPIASGATGKFTVKINSSGSFDIYQDGVFLDTINLLNGQYASDISKKGYILVEETSFNNANAGHALTSLSAVIYNDPPTTTTTPTLAFTATDPEGDQVSYQIQVSTSSSFATTHMDVTTATFASGTQQNIVVSPALTQGGIVYYWRVRAKDPSGTGTYGAWSATRTFRTADDSSNFLAFFYP